MEGQEETLRLCSSVVSTVIQLQIERENKLENGLSCFRLVLFLRVEESFVLGISANAVQLCAQLAKETKLLCGLLNENVVLQKYVIEPALIVKKTVAIIIKSMRFISFTLSFHGCY